MRKIVKKLYYPKYSDEVLVSVRNYEVEECIKKNDAMHIVHGDKIMTMDPHSLQTKQRGTSDVFKSQHGGKDYFLINYLWVPNIYEDD
jgi:hypothetical protein